MAKSVLSVSKVEKLDVDYDEGADVLYISFGQPVAASDSKILENDVVVRYKGERIIGITVPSFKNRLKHDRPTRMEAEAEASGRLLSL